MLGFAFMHKADLSGFFVSRKNGEDIKNTFIIATLIIGEIIAFDCVGSYCQQQGKVKRIKEVHTLKHQLTQIYIYIFLIDVNIVEYT